MVWVVVAAVVLAVLVVGERQRRRDREDRARPGLPARRQQPRRGVGGLGEAPVTIHHRLGGRRSDD